MHPDGRDTMGRLLLCGLRSRILRHPARLEGMSIFCSLAHPDVVRISGACPFIRARSFPSSRAWHRFWRPVPFLGLMPFYVASDFVRRLPRQVRMQSDGETVARTGTDPFGPGVSRGKPWHLDGRVSSFTSVHVRCDVPKRTGLHVSWSSPFATLFPCPATICARMQSSACVLSRIHGLVHVQPVSIHRSLPLEGTCCSSCAKKRLSRVVLGERDRS